MSDGPNPLLSIVVPIKDEIDILAGNDDTAVASSKP